jgi:5,10-methylenetetrahydromethanopterin reductase
MLLTLSCALVPSHESPHYARIAESLGYTRAFFYDSPALYPDMWVQLCRAAERTDRIGLGTGVIVPSNRHPMTTASAIATLVHLAGAERFVLGVGTGFTSRMAMGQPALSWRYVEDYVQTVQGLLRGEVMRWAGAAIQLMHSPGIAPSRPCHVPVLLAADGTKGQSVARRHGYGVLTTRSPAPGFERCVTMAMGTVLDDGENPESERVLDAAGHAGGVLLHLLHTRGQLPADEQQNWLRGYDLIPAGRRHLAMHYGHLVHLNDLDRPYVTGRRLVEWGMAMDRGGWAAFFDQIQRGGATEVAYQPAGRDIPRELEAFAAAFHDFAAARST